jgi:hypothetical protein
MSQLHTIKDERTIYCRVAMKANGGEWNPMSGGWMFREVSDHANALSDLYRATRLSVAMREALLTMVADGTGALAWGFDPAEKPLALDDLDRGEASKLLAAGYAVRRVLGVHPLDDVAEIPEDGVFDASEFEARSHARKRRRRNAA